MRLRSPEGREFWLTIIVPPEGCGTVYVSTGKWNAELDPEDVSKVRKLLLDAQAKALRDRWRW